MRRSRPELALRALAFTIAIAAAIDPAITSNHIVKPEVAVVAVDPRLDSAEASRARRALEKSFDVIPAALPSADATVLVGDRVPSSHDLLASPVFALLGDRQGATVTIDAVTAPAEAPVSSHVAIVAALHVTGARGRDLEVQLRDDALVVDRVVRRMATDDETLSVPLMFVPTVATAAPLRVTASLSATNAGPHTTATSDLLVHVRDTKWAVLFFDPRPSWMSTFVRRAIESDDRFVVTSRVVTSRNISTDAGTPPGHLDDLAALGLFDAVVVGAPDALSEADVSGLDAFLRRRAGAVILLLDQWANGPWQRLDRSGGGQRDSSRTLLSVADLAGDSAQLRVSEIAWPSRLPLGGEPLARTIAAGATGTGGRDVIWHSAVGAGRLITSGALDAWRYRDPGTSGFDRFWRALIASAANNAPRPITIHVAEPVTAPGMPVALGVELRDPALQFSSSATGSVHATLSASIESDARTHPDHGSISLWPTGDPGSLRGTMLAPSAPGGYRVVVSSGGYHAEVPLRVLAGATAARNPEDELLAAWVASRGGRAFPAHQVQELSAALTGALHPAGHPVRWHPMRSTWWILPFALALSGEWWLRRRRGLS